MKLESRKSRLEVRNGEAAHGRAACEGKQSRRRFILAVRERRGDDPVADWERWRVIAFEGGVPSDYSDEAIIWPMARCSGAGKRCGSAGTGTRRTGLIMSEPFRPYEKLVEITIFGKKFSGAGSAIRFCGVSSSSARRRSLRSLLLRNQDCQYCRVSCQLPDEDEPHEMLSCKIHRDACEWKITEMSQELKWCLRAKLPSDTPVTS